MHIKHEKYLMNILEIYYDWARAVEKSVALSFYLDAKNTPSFMKGGIKYV